MVCWGSASLVGWTDDKLQHMVKLIVGDEQFDDIGNGTDGGLFDIFPYLHDRITIREVLEREDSDSAGSLVDFIEDDMNEEEEESDSSSSDFQGDEESEESEDVDTGSKRGGSEPETRPETGGRREEEEEIHCHIRL